MAERQDQLQSLSFPLSLPIILGYIVSLIVAESGSTSTFFDVLAYLPPTAPFAMPVLVGLGQATWWEFALSVVLEHHWHHRRGPVRGRDLSPGNPSDRAVAPVP